MNSTIRVAFDYEKKEPYLQIQVGPPSDLKGEDLRDEMLKNLVSELNGAVLELKYPDHNDDNLSPQLRLKKLKS